MAENLISQLQNQPILPPQPAQPPQDAQQVSHELDFLIVHNPDVNCDDVDTELGWSHRDYFQIEWDKQPHRVKPGETRIMPRFLAKHFAKHLANHILMRREEKEKRTGLVQSPIERPKLLEQILLGVHQYYLATGTISEGEKVAKMVDEINPQERALDLGKVVDPTIGVLKPEGPSLEKVMKEAEKEESQPNLEPKVEITQTPTNVKVPMPNNISTLNTSLFDPSKPKPTKMELLKEAWKMGIEVTGKENVDELISKIKQF